MKAQLSLEFLLYTALAAVSTLSAISLYLYVRGSQEVHTSRTYSEELVALINANMAYDKSTFYAVVPVELCNATLNGSEVSTDMGTFYMAGNLTIQKSACSGKGSMEHLSLERLFNGTYVLEGAG